MAQRSQSDLTWPFGKLEGVHHDDLRETAYDIFFTACRTSPGFEANTNAFLKTLKRSPSKRTIPCQIPSSPNGHVGSSSPRMTFTLPPNRARRTLASAEIMRQQMRVPEYSDSRLRKTLMRTLLGKTSRRAETIILPLELLRHLKPSDFNNTNEYHLWQRRQLKLLELGLLVHPSIPLDKSNTHVRRLKDIIRASESKPIDTGKNSEAIRTLCNCVVSLSWRSFDSTTPADSCHSADGFPLNVHIYVALLHAIFDLKDDTLVLDEVDELLELMKKTWSTLGINGAIHNLCFTWVFFEQYVTTSQAEPDLLGTSLAMLTEVASDAKSSDKGGVAYGRMLMSVLSSMQSWSEIRLINYHEYFDKSNVGLMENLLQLVLSARKITEDDVADAQGNTEMTDQTRIQVEEYIRSSLRDVFAKAIQEGKISSTNIELEANEELTLLTKMVEDLALKEKETFSPILKGWNQNAAAVAAATLHSCYGATLRQYLTGVSRLTNETVRVLQKAGHLETVLVQTVAEDSADSADEIKALVREMVPYEVESVIMNLLKKWIDERLKSVKDCIHRAKETETWNPKSKTDPYAYSAMELVRLAKATIDDFFKIPITIYDYLVYDLSDGLEHLFREYTNFVASCGLKQSYIPALPPLTRSRRDTNIIKLWHKASPCRVREEGYDQNGGNEGHDHPRPSTSRGTQRLYIRLNTLHYLLSHVQAFDKTLSLSPLIVQSDHHRLSHKCKHHLAESSPSYFDLARSAVQAAMLHVSEVAAYRLIFLDSKSVFYDSLYVGDVANARIEPALRLLKQNMTLLKELLVDRAQPIALKQIMKAAFEAYLMVLLAGGCYRAFSRSDHVLIEEDVDSLKKTFSNDGEGLMNEEMVEREAETVEGVVALMSRYSEQLVEDFSIVNCETSGVGTLGQGQKLTMPPTTGRWNRADPNTILRVLCHRNDRAANHFLKKTFHLAKGI